uniref:Myosin binding protein C, fast type a n=1 Tax=Cyprinus carpio TaxID=7962 RepID=A0A8C2D2V5_CYPCA
MPEPKKPGAKGAKVEAPPADKPAEDDEGRDELPEDEHVPGEEPQMSQISGLLVEKPQSVTAIKGKNVTFVAKVDSYQLLRKPNMKWLKGKWMDLGSKAGKHLQFKETYDRNTKIYTYEMTIVKVVDGDAGGYRCEVTSKDKCDSCTFDISVEDAGEDAGELDFSGLLKKRERKQKEEPEINVDVWEILKNAKPCDYEKIAFEYGITDLRGMLKRLKKMKKVEPKKSDAFLKKLDPAYSVEKGKKIQLSVELADPNAQVKWLRNGQEIKPSAKYIFESVGGIRKLTINKCTLADDAAYECVVGEEKSFTEVFVQEPPVTITKMLDDVHVVVGEKVEFEVEVSDEGYYWTHCHSFSSFFSIIEKELEVLQSIADLTLKAAEQAVFKCEVSDEKVTGKWFKDGVEVIPSDRIKMTHIGRYSSPLTASLIDSCISRNTSSLTSPILLYARTLKPIKPPKIHLDTTGSFVNKNTIIVVAGNKLRFDVDITGDPPPTVCWKKGDTVRASEGRVRVETRKNLSCFVIEGAERADEGLYHITVTNPAGEDKADVMVKIVDVPDPPENVKCTGVGEDSASIQWDPPTFDGGVPVKGYLMERKKKGSSRWTKLNFDIYESTTYEAKKMIEGVLYEMRVFAVNGIGMSQPSASSKPFMPIAPTSEPTRLTVEDVTDGTCALKWLPPERIGAGGIDGYIIEYCVEGGEARGGLSTEWVQANETPVEKNSYRVRGLPVGEKMLFRVTAVNIAGRSPPAVMAQAVTIREIVERPKIRLPRELRTKYIKRVGEKVNLVIPFQGKPRPVVTWLKDGAPLDTKLVNIRTSDVDTILFIRQAAREHSGQYTLSVQIENMEDKVNLEIQIVDKPGPPIAVTVTDVWGFNAALEWKPPKDNGNCEITGYTIQKADLKTKEWFTVLEHNRRPSCTVSDLVMGNEYTFRVFSENICGMSDDAGISKNTAAIAKTGTYTLPYKEKDMCSSPKFITPLMDRSVIAGYSAAISCAVRGYPKPKIIWMKNKMIIGEDPKYLMQNNQGVLTLNIRKPSLFDGGKYTCKAINDLGEDEVECKLVVRGTYGQKSPSSPVCNNV